MYVYVSINIFSLCIVAFVRLSTEFELFIPLCSMETCNRCPNWAVSEKLNDANAVSPTLGTFFITTCRSLLCKSQAKELLLTHYGLRKGILRLAEKNLVQTSAYSLHEVCMHVLFFRDVGLSYWDTFSKMNFDESVDVSCNVQMQELLATLGRFDLGLRQSNVCGPHCQRVDWGHKNVRIVELS